MKILTGFAPIIDGRKIGGNSNLSGRKFCRKKGYWKETLCSKSGSTVTAAQDQALRTNIIKAKIDKTSDCSLCRLYKEADEAVTHIASQCSKLAQLEYKIRHDKVAQALYWELCRKNDLQHEKNRYEHNPQSVVENDKCKILWDFTIQTDHYITARRPDIVVVNKNDKTCLLIDVACPGDKRVKEKEDVFSKQCLFQYAYFYIACMTCYTLHTQWLVFATILLCGDVETNPGPETLDFCCWNLNSIAAHDFLRISLIEAYNSVCNYDLIGIVETHIDSTVDEDRLALDGYTFYKENHPQDVKRGGVGLYVKDALPSKNRPDLVTLPKCVVCEIQLNKKKYFFVVIYRSPSQNQNEFDNFTIKFELLLSKLHAENPFCVIITGDFNCRQWWENDIENNEGKLFEPVTSDLGLHQLISEPTHLMGDSKSCIDLILTDQPNLVIESGVHPSLHEHCHHQIVHGKLSVSNIARPPYTRRIWYYDKADFVAIMKSIEMFNWHEHLNKIKCPNEQVKLLNEVLLNIYSNFIPNQVKTIQPRKLPWITKDVKRFLRKKNHAYRTFVKNGQPEDKLEGILNMVAEGTKMIEDAKQNYLRKTGQTLANPGTSRKTYWTLINTVLNKAKIPIIPPLLENGLFITDFTEKAQLFNDYFILQCTTIDTGSEIPQDPPEKSTLIEDFCISEEKILKIIRSLNPNKAHGWDEISIRMIKLSDVSLVTPLKIIFTNCLKHGVFPEIWKCANVVPVHKKNEKNLKSNYRPISLLPIFGKMLERLMYDSLYSHLVSCDLLNPNQSGFRPGDSTINQLISITHTIFQAFDCNPPP